MRKRKKTGGRKKGTPNKVNAEAKELILKVLKNETEQLDSMLLFAEPKQRLDFIIKLLPYVCSKQQRKIEFNQDLSDFEITVNSSKSSLYSLFNQEKRIKELENIVHLKDS